MKTIAVHFPNAAVADRLLDLAVPLARAHAAALVGVHVSPSVVVYADSTVVMSTEFVVAQQETFRDEAVAVERLFRERMQAAGDVAADWRQEAAGDEPAMRLAATCCNTADLVIAAQAQAAITAASGYTPDQLSLLAGRPVLIVPASGETRRPGARVVVAWNGSREAARAAFDCLQLLKPGAEVDVVTVESSRGESTVEAIAGTFTRYGHKVRCASLVRQDGRSVSGEILTHASSVDADMLVVGCYGHSRLRETIFGGATTRILRDMTLPVLMSH